MINGIYCYLALKCMPKREPRKEGERINRVKGSIKINKQRNNWKRILTNFIVILSLKQKLSISLQLLQRKLLIKVGSLELSIWLLLSLLLPNNPSSSIIALTPFYSNYSHKCNHAKQLPERERDQARKSDRERIKLLTSCVATFRFA